MAHLIIAGSEERELKLILAEELKIIGYEEWLTSTMKKIKEERINLSVEIMQIKYELECKIKEKNNELSEESPEEVNSTTLIDVKMLDQENSAVNTKHLDLTILDKFHSHHNNESDDREDDEIMFEEMDF